MIQATCMNCGEIKQCHQVEDIGWICAICRPSFPPRNVSEFMEKQFADPKIKAVYERLAKR